MDDVSVDVRLADSANAFALHHDGWEDVARAYAQLSEPLFIALVVLLAVIGVARRQSSLVWASGLAVAAAGVGLTVAVVVSRIVARPRPFVTHPQIHLFLAHAPDPGFPSDHATAAFAIAAALMLRLGHRALPVLIGAGALAVSRVLVGVHYPTDVLVGALLGIAAALLVCVIVAHPPGRMKLRSSPRRELAAGP